MRASSSPASSSSKCSGRGRRARVVRAARAPLDHLAAPRRRRRRRGRPRCRARRGAAAPAAGSPPPRPRPGTRGRPSARRRTPALQDAGAEAEPAAKRCATSQCSAKVARAIWSAFASVCRDHRLADLGRAPGPDLGREEGAAPPRGCPPSTSANVARGSMSSPYSSRRLGRVRRAAEGVQQGDVVGVRELLRRGARELAEPDGEDRRPQRVLERLAGAQVGRERHGADHFGGADLGLVGLHRAMLVEMVRSRG